MAAFMRLRWRLLRGAIRHGGTEQAGAIVSTVASAIVGLGVGATALVLGQRTDHPVDMAVIFCTVVVIAVVGFGVVAGIAQPIDPRVMAAEPLDDRQRAIGLLAATSCGPPGLAGIVVGAGLVAGMTRNAATFPIVLLGGLSWLLALLLVARTATNGLALLITRAQRLGQVVVGLFGLVFYGSFQFVPAVIGGLDDEQRHQLAGWMKLTPPGQVGEAIGSASTAPAAAIVHLVLGSLWLPFLAIGFEVSTSRLAAATRRQSGGDTADATRTRLGRQLRRLCGSGTSGAIAWRSLLTRFRTPRTALEAFIGAGVGLGAVLVPILTRDTIGSGAVLVGGAVQLAVLFMSGNSFGTDGPAVTHELLAGVDLPQLVRGKARSIAIVAAPLAVIGPTIVAVVSGEWQYYTAGLAVGVGSLLAGTGAAVVQSALVPIAMPETDNPFASGESGKGIVAALLLVVVLIGLSVVTVPVALAMVWATGRDSTALVTALAIASVLIGWGMSRLGVAIASHRLGGREPEFVAAVTPAR